MPPVTKSQIAELQKRPESIRNICILAHIDHGMTLICAVLSAVLCGANMSLNRQDDLV